MKSLISSICLLMSLAMGWTQAATIHVPSEYPTIQAGIDAAVDGDTVAVAAGTYSGSGNQDIDLQGKTIAVLGSGPGTCHIVCDTAENGFHCHRGEQDATIISGFHIFDSQSAGIRIFQASPTIENCYITNGGSGIWCGYSESTILNCRMESCDGYGIGVSYSRVNIYDSMMLNGDASGIDIWYSQVCMKRCELKRNSSDLGGGGVMSWKSSLSLEHCVIENNELHGENILYGAGVFSFGDSLIMEHCVVQGNTIYSDPPYYEPGDGAGIFIQSNALLENCLILDNSVENGTTGGIYCGSPDYTDINHCTITGNEGFGLSTGSSYTRIHHCILWDETGFGSHGEAWYCDMLNLVSGNNNFSEDPLFVSGPDGNYYLSQTDAGQLEQSPCVDAGYREAMECVIGDYHLGQLTTRSDLMVDTGLVDLGYHYPAGSLPPTPTLTATPTPSMEPTATPTPEINRLGVDLELSDDHLEEGDTFLLQAIVSNPGPEIYGDIPLVIVMEIFDLIFWYPTWTTDFAMGTVDMPIGTQSINIIDVTWPQISGSVSGVRIYGALLNDTYSEILGEWDFVEFGW